jgi:ketosteroid isomerase-like protein
MSERNVEIVAQGMKAFNRGDVDGILSRVAPDVEFEVEEMPEFPGWLMFRGHDGVREFLTLTLEPWESFRVDVERLIDLGDRVVLIGVYAARGRNGLDLKQPRGVVYTLHDGKIVHARFFASPEHALDAAGIEAKHDES